MFINVHRERTWLSQPPSLPTSSLDAPPQPEENTMLINFIKDNQMNVTYDDLVNQKQFKQKFRIAPGLIFAPGQNQLNPTKDLNMEMN